MYLQYIMNANRGGHCEVSICIQDPLHSKVLLKQKMAAGWLLKWLKVKILKEEAEVAVFEIHRSSVED